MCTENKKLSEAQFNAKTLILGGGGSKSSKKARIAVSLVALSEEDVDWAELGHSAQSQYSTTVPVEAEMIKYINYMKSIMLVESDIDLLPSPLNFYSKGNDGNEIS